MCSIMSGSSPSCTVCEFRPSCCLRQWCPFMLLELSTVWSVLMTAVRVVFQAIKIALRALSSRRWVPFLPSGTCWQWNCCITAYAWGQHSVFQLCHAWVFWLLHMPVQVRFQSELSVTAPALSTPTNTPAGPSPAPGLTDFNSPPSEAMLKGHGGWGEFEVPRAEALSLPKRGRRAQLGSWKPPLAPAAAEGGSWEDVVGGTSGFLPQMMEPETTGLLHGAGNALLAAQGNRETGWAPERGWHAALILSCCFSPNITARAGSITALAAAGGMEWNIKMASPGRCGTRLWEQRPLELAKGRR